MNKLRESMISILKPIVERFPSINKMYRVMRDNRRNLQPRRTPLGFLFQGNPLMESGQFEPVETRLVSRLLSKVDILVNVGANVGYYCCLALQAGKTVVAFEPMPGNLHHLLRNIKINGWDSRAEVFPMALSDRTGVIEIYGGGTGASLVRGWANVPEDYVSLVAVHTADDVLAHRLRGLRSLYIVDIEGSELQFLEGAAQLLAQLPRPIWMVEINITEHFPCATAVNPALESTFGVFFDHGYQAWTVTEPMRRVFPEQVGVIARSGVDAFHTHNFVFAHDSTAIQEATA